MESFDQCRRLQVREKARNVFVMSLRLSDHKVVTQRRISSSFFRFRSDFLTFCARILYFKFLDLRNLIKQLLHSHLLDMRLHGYSQLGTTLFTISYPTRAHGIIVNYYVNQCLYRYACSMSPDNFCFTGLQVSSLLL